MRIDIPKDADTIISIFENNGYEAYVVGGCVRDSILDRKPEDWDITTSAKPEEIKELFHKTIDTGIQHGTVTIRMGGCSYETTTFRIDGEYEDNRHPKNVEFTSLLSEDLKRRDFTINAMAYSPDKGLIDMFGGIDDINNKIIRCVGNPFERFSEDALRTLRAVRFAGQLGFEIEENTYAAMAKIAPNIATISAERIRVEITKLLMSKGPDKLLTAKEAGLTKVFLPEWDAIVEKGDGERIIRSVNIVNKLSQGMEERDRRILAFAMLLAETGNAKDIMKRMKFDNYSISMVDRLTKKCTCDFDISKIELRKFISKSGLDMMELLYMLRQAYYSGFGDEYSEYMMEIDRMSKACYEQIVADKDPLTIGDLMITGNDLMENGIPKGKMVGSILNALLDAVLEKPELNHVNWLLKKSAIFYDEMNKTLK